LLDYLPRLDGVRVSSKASHLRLSHCLHVGVDGNLNVCHGRCPVSGVFSTGGSSYPPCGGHDPETDRSCLGHHDLISARWKIFRHVAAAFDPWHLPPPSSESQHCDYPCL
jgi:hypothetical protein